MGFEERAYVSRREALSSDEQSLDAVEAARILLDEHVEERGGEPEDVHPVVGDHGTQRCGQQVRAVGQDRRSAAQQHPPQFEAERVPGKGCALWHDASGCEVTEDRILEETDGGPVG